MIEKTTDHPKAETSGSLAGTRHVVTTSSNVEFTTGTATLEQLKSLNARRLPRPTRTGPRPQTNGQ